VDPIQYPQYFIEATVQAASAFRQGLSNPLLHGELTFLYTDDDIRVWLPANLGKDPLHLLVLESRQDLGEGPDQIPGPASGRHPFRDCKRRDHFGLWDDM